MDLMDNTVTIKASTNGITVVLDGSKTFDEIKAATAAKFKASASFLGNAKMAITFDGPQMTEEQKSELLNDFRQLRAPSHRFLQHERGDEQNRNDQVYSGAHEGSLHRKVLQG